MSYNGWSNYETWDVALWIDNEEGSYNYWREQVTRAVDQNTNSVDDEVDRDSAISDLSRQLESEIKDSNPLAGDASMYSDILSANLSEVDWYEIVEHWVDDEIESRGLTVEKAVPEAV